MWENIEAADKLCWPSGVRDRIACWVRATAMTLPLLSLALPRAAADDDTTIPRRIVVATREVPPFAMRNDEGEWIGISIELLREVKLELQSAVENEISLVFRELGLEEMLDAVERGEVDLAVAAITVNFEREKRLDFTHPFHNSGLGIAVSARQRPAGWTGVVRAVFSQTFLRIVLALFGALFVSAVAIYLFERRRNREHFGGGAIRGIAAGLWWAAVTLTTVGYGDKVPKTVPGRLLGLLWMFAGLFIVASFTAAVTSALTVTQLKSRIAGPADLPRVRTVTVEGSTSAEYLRARYINYRAYPDISAALQALQQQHADAVVYDAPILRHEVYRHFAGLVFVLPITFERQDYAFALPSASPLRERINQVLLRKIGSPEWREVLARYFGETAE